MSYDSKKEWSGVMFAGESIRSSSKERRPSFENKQDKEKKPPFEEGNWVEAKEDVHEFFGSRTHLIKKGEQLRLKETRWGSVYKQWYIGLDGLKGLYEAEKFVKIRAPAQGP